MLYNLQPTQIIINSATALVFLIISLMLVEILRISSKGGLATKSTLTVLSTACFTMMFHSIYNVVPLAFLVIGLGFMYLVWKILKNPKVVLV